MKTIMSLCIVYFLLTSVSCSQSNKIEAGYAYARDILQGSKPPVVVSEDGSVIIKPRQPGIQYFIFAATKASSAIAVKRIRIKGKEYSANADSIKNLQDALIRNSITPEMIDTTITHGGYRLWKINVGQLITPSETTRTKSGNSKSNEVVIEYVSKDHVRYYSISKIIFLEPVRLD